MLTRSRLDSAPSFGGPNRKLKLLMRRSGMQPGLQGDTGDVFEMQHPRPVIQGAVQETQTPPQLTRFIQALAAKGGELEWLRWSSNLETRLDGHPVRLSRDERTIPQYPLFDLQVFPKRRFFPLFSSPLFSLENVGHDVQPTGPELERIFNTALKTLPELKMSVSEDEQDFRFFQIHNSPFTLVFPKRGLDRKHAELGSIPDKVEWALLVREAKPIVLEDLKTPSGFKGYVDETGFHPLEGVEKPLSVNDFEKILERAGVSMDTVIAKGRKLHEDNRSGWWPFNNR